MKVFISWSGERSLALAEALRGWLPLVLHYVEPWLSKSDIDAGKRWDDELSKILSDCNFGISCVTSDNVTAPWLLFESGALAKSVADGQLVPLLLGIDIKDLSGPLSRFQAKKVDRAGITEILQGINKIAVTPVPEQRLTDLIELAWDKFQELIDAVPASATPAKSVRDQSDILEELVSGVRSVEARIRDFSDDDEFSRKRRRGKLLGPPMIRELTHEMSSTDNDPIQIVILSSFFRDDVPWLYELGLLAYKSVMAGEIAQSRNALRAFQRGLKMITHGPFGREFGLDRERMHMLLMETEMAFDGDLAERYAVKIRRPRKEAGSSI